MLPSGFDPDAGYTLSKVSFALERGEWVALLGANGSGKSTLARLANGLLLPTEGEVVVEGISSWQHDNLTQLRKLVGLVTQDPDNQMVSTTVFDEVAFGTQNLGWEAERIYTEVSTALAKVGLDEDRFAKRDPNTLSGGEKQRVVIAAILAMQPHYLVLDEPTSMLDPRSRTHVLEAIAHAALGGHGILHITHHLEEAALASRVLVLNEGILVYDGTPADILSDKAALTQYGLWAEPRVRGQLSGQQNQRAQSGQHGQPAQYEQQAQTTMRTQSAQQAQCVSADASAHNAQFGQYSQPAQPEQQAQTTMRTQSAQAEESVLNFNEVRFSYPQSNNNDPVLDDLTLELKTGECILLVGASGSGKSTLLSLASGLLKPDSGEVLLNGKAPEPGQIGLVFQQPEGQLFAQTLKEDILFGPKNLGMPQGMTEETLVDETLNAVGLAPERFKERSPFSLSGGEARRAAIATTLALDTKLLLLDEPTAGLDARGKVFIYELLQQLLAQGKGFILATHDPEFFADLATRKVEL